MLKELLQALTGSVQTAAFAYPSANGVNNINIPPQATFGKILSNTFHSLSSNPFANSPIQPMPQVQNYGAAPMYNNGFQYLPNEFQRLKGSNHKREALTPGAVVNALALPPQPNAVSQVSQFANITNPLANTINPLQGFAGQGGITQGGFPSYSPTYSNGFAGQAGSGQGKLGLLGLVIGPVMGLFGLIKSFLGLRSEMASIQPIQNPADEIKGYQDRLASYTRTNNTDGSFDEDYWGESRGSSQNYEAADEG